MDLQELKQNLSGDLYLEEDIRTLYATDASAYRELPLAVVIPKDEEDLGKLIAYAAKNHLSLIPRTAGTSLAGQVVGNGIVVDVSKHFTKILEINTEEQWVRVQPGVVRDELNLFLEEYGFLFGPETSTANRAMIGGMIGNNSCGSNSIVYGSTRDNLLSVKAILSDGTETTFQEETPESFHYKMSDSTLSDRERSIYKNIHDILSVQKNRESISRDYPRKNIPRRNTGYALDLLMETKPFGDFEENFNFCKLLAGSEGTLAFITEAKLKIQPLPPKHTGLLCVHFESVHESLLGNLVALHFNPSASELMDHYILECTKGNKAQRENRFFIKGDPQALLVVELKRDSEEELQRDAKALTEALKEKGYGYHYPLVTGPDTKKVWNLRKAGLGLLSNMPGDAKPVPVIEDTAVDVQDLPQYILEFNELLKKRDLYCVHYAHAGSGELHLRPIIDLKTEEGNKLFKTIAEEVALLVKKYNGSLSGEHGDGRLRGEFIPKMIGEANYQLLKAVKESWDPGNIFNPGKITDTPEMNTMLRFKPGQTTRDIKTILNFDSTLGFTRAVEQCNGSGDCRKSHLMGGTMCPSFMATRNEKDSTRARANILRETITRSTKSNPLDSKEAFQILDLCLSCKGCTSECPSNVDMARIKAEFLHQYYLSNKPSLRTRLIAGFSGAYRLGSLAPALFNVGIKVKFISNLVKSFLGIAPQRTLPVLASETLKKWYEKSKSTNFGVSPAPPIGAIYLFIDEFSNYNDVETGKKAIQLLTRLGYEVRVADNEESGRTFLSKGFLKQAREKAQFNVTLYKELISEEVPLLGIEPSAILSFRDEYPDLVDRSNRSVALDLSKNCLLIDEFISREIDKGLLKQELFTDKPRQIKLHGHCHQKALSSLTHTKKMLTLPQHYTVEIVPSGCCGMAGSFGYEKEHYDLSQQVGELVLFPAVRSSGTETIIAAPGTSCRHQIYDGTGRKALHPVEILWEALLG
ncbi:MAG: FAD-binding protein [Cyclobacteriaceae bacterium]|nr:FAD-binding protein [Cyclobacteriaceae bacterium]